METGVDVLPVLYLRHLTLCRPTRLSSYTSPSSYSSSLLFAVTREREGKEHFARRDSTHLFSLCYGLGREERRRANSGKISGCAAVPSTPVFIPGTTGPCLTLLRRLTLSSYNSSSSH